MRLGRTVVLAVVLIVVGAAAAEAMFPVLEPDGFQSTVTERGQVLPD
jgi:hypothetical protein